MNTGRSYWYKPLGTILAMLALVWIAPTAPIDPWNLISLKKVAILITALTFIQVIGSTLARILGVKAGGILTGFLGGLISSTAMTAALANKSKTSIDEDVSAEILTFFTATSAMLFEGIALIFMGTTETHFALLLIFLGPILATTWMVIRHSQNVKSSSLNLEPIDFRLLPILKLSAFIVVILALSKGLQNIFGHYGLMILTFLVSLFEIHGSVIANVQLHDSGVIDVRLLGNLLALSIAASYLSKLFFDLFTWKFFA